MNYYFYECACLRARLELAVSHCDGFNVRATFFMLYLYTLFVL